MLIHRLRNARRYQSKSVVDIHTTFLKMKKTGRLAHLPKKWHRDMVPKSWVEICSPCLICHRMIHSESHYSFYHPDLNHHQLKALSVIGRTLLNRLSSPGSSDNYPKGSARADVLLNKLKEMYGARDSVRLRMPCRRVQQRNSNIVAANTFLSELLKDRPSISRKMSVPLNDLRLNRADLMKNRNLFCLACGLWIKGNWINHDQLKHRKFSQIERRVIRLYSARLKAFMLMRVLFVERKTLKSIKQKVFFSFLEDCEYSICKEYETASAQEKIRWFFGVKQRRIVNVDYTIRYDTIESVYKQPLNSKILNVAYRRLQQLYAGDVWGFTDLIRYLHRDIDSNMRKDFRLANPSNKESINFFFVRTPAFSTRRVGHVVLSHYKDGSLVIYEGGGAVRLKPIAPYLKSVILAHHCYKGRSVRAGYSREYSVQWDKWTCAYRAIFACFAVLCQKNPEDFDPDFDQIFGIIKKAVENNGKKLRFWTLDQIWDVISIKKLPRRRPRVPIRYEVLTDE